MTAEILASEGGDPFLSGQARTTCPGPGKEIPHSHYLLGMTFPRLRASQFLMDERDWLSMDLFPAEALAWFTHVETSPSLPRTLHVSRCYPHADEI